MAAGATVRVGGAEAVKAVGVLSEAAGACPGQR